MLQGLAMPVLFSMLMKLHVRRGAAHHSIAVGMRTTQRPSQRATTHCGGRGVNSPILCAVDANLFEAAMFQTRHTFIVLCL